MKVEIPKNLNGFQLLDELKSAGIVVADDMVFIGGDQLLTINVDEKDEAKTAEIVANHVGIERDLKAEKQAVLDKLGLTAEEIAALLS